MHVIMVVYKLYNIYTDKVNKEVIDNKGYMVLQIVCFKDQLTNIQYLCEGTKVNT